jgi:hypothetical protein
VGGADVQATSNSLSGLREPFEQELKLGSNPVMQLGIGREGRIAVAAQDGLEPPDERSKLRWIAGLKHRVQLLPRLGFGPLLDRLVHQSEKSGLIALALAARAPIGQIGLNRLLPSNLRSFGVAGGALKVLQN